MIIKQNLLKLTNFEVLNSIFETIKYKIIIIERKDYMKKSIVAMSLLASFMIGCGAQAPVTFDSAKSVTVSQSLISGDPMVIGKDTFLNKNEWAYGLHFIPEKSITKDKNAIVPDKMKIKVFYLAQHADSIILQGNDRNSCNKVIKYLHSEGVTGNTFNQCKGVVRDTSEKVIVAMTFVKGAKGYQEAQDLLKDTE